MRADLSRRRWWLSFVRAVSWHRRKLAVVAVVAAVLSGLGALAPPQPDTVPVIRVRTGLPAGTKLSADHLRLDQVPPDTVPEGAYHDSADVVDRLLLSGRVARGQMLSAADLAGPTAALTGNQVIAPLRLADDQVATLLSEGMIVDVLAADDRGGSAAVVAGAARVVAVPPSADGSRVDGAERLVLVAVSRSTAAALAKAAVVSRLSVVWR